MKADYHEDEFLLCMRRIEALIHEIEACTDPAMGAAAHGIVQALLDLHQAAIDRIVHRLAEHQHGSQQLLDQLVEDELISSILLLHDLHPWDTQRRVDHAMQSLGSKLKRHDARIEQIQVSDRVIRMRLELESSGGCQSSKAALSKMIEDTLRDCAPDVPVIEVFSDNDESPSATAVQLTVGGASDRPDPLVEPSH